ncbi:neurexin-1a [Nephila pilipes]|uniref:Neurexin-1a n=1 Tax=Nephila pilipes TaxID=299642 RepID=A0A8X6N883_NEPPI|nr:neurexin-1a [Nephila pilipes]
MGTEKPPASLTSASSNKEIPNFVGHMQHFIFNGQHFFDMARSGQMTNFKVTAKFGKKDEIVHHPVTFKSKFTFIGLSQLKAYSSMNLYFQFKTLEPNGLILFNGGKGQDFIAIELVDGHLHYIFNLGDGPRKVRSNTRTTLNDNQWHAVTIGRPSVKQHTLMVDDMIATVASTGSNVHLDLDGLLYLGGVRRASYTALPKLVQSRHGFEGCLASLDLNGETIDPIKDAVVPSTLVSSGCAGPVTKCSTTACANRGICVQMWNSYTCDCDMTSYTGPTCSDESISYKFGARGGLITFTYPSEKRPDTKSDLLALGFMSSTDNAVLVRIDSGSSNDYMELEIVDGNVFMVYNMGTEDHPIGELSVNVNDHQYHVIRFTRSGPNSTIQIDDHNVRTKQPTGRQHTIFNSHSKIQVGGKFNSIKNKIERPFQGVISGLVFGGNRILDMAAEDDPRVSLQGDVELLITMPPDGQTVDSAENSEEKSSTADPTEPTEETVFSGAGSGCWDDEDDCEASNNEKQELITPEFVSPTPEDLSQPNPGEACEDDDDCSIDIGSGISEGEVGRPEDILLTIPTGHPLFPERGPMSSKPTIPPIMIVSHSNLPPDQPPYAKTTRVPAVVYEVPIPGLMPNGKDYQRPTQRTRSSADNTALVIGVIAGALIAIVLIALIVYKLRNRTEGSYKVDESKNYQFGTQFGAIAASPAFLNGPMPPVNSLSKGHPEKTPKKKKGGKDLKEWYV